MDRRTILEEAITCVCETRDQQYGSVQNNFKRIAEFWTTYLSTVNHSYVGVKPDDVGIMMALLKIARMASGQTKDDNYIDCAGYIGCAGEIAKVLEEEPW